MTTTPAAEQNSPRQRVAIVTGAGRGIGAAIAARLAADGVTVAATDIDPASAEHTAARLRADGHDASAYPLDVSSEDAVEQVVTQIADELGPPTVLVNNAGLLRDNLLFRMSSADWDTVSNVHLRGSFLMTRGHPGLHDQSPVGPDRELELDLSSGQQRTGQLRRGQSRTPRVHQTVALELGRFGITCNAVAPGFIVTDMTRATAQRLGQDFTQFTFNKCAHIPVRRPGQPEDVADAVWYFCRPEAGFVSGQVLYVAGGPKA